MARSEARLVSEPHRVIWAGFETTTPRLQQAGWEIAAEQDFMSDAVRLVMRHQDMQCMAVTNAVRFYDLAHRMHINPMARYQAEAGRDWLLTFHVVRMSHKVQFEVMADYRPNFKLIDAMPQFVDRMYVDVEDMGIFATPLVRTDELIVDPDEVSSILEKIRAAQVPEQAAIRARERQRESREGLQLGAEPQTRFHAQILSLVA